MNTNWEKTRKRRTMDNLRNAVPRDVNCQVRIFRDLESLVHPNHALDDSIPRLSIHTTPVGSLAIIKRGRNVNKEEVPAGACLMHDCLAYGLASRLVRRNWRCNNCCASARKLRRDKCYSLQVIVAFFPRKDMVCRRSVTTKTV